MRLSSLANPVQGSAGGTGLKASHDVAMRLATVGMIPALEGVHTSALITPGEQVRQILPVRALASPNYSGGPDAPPGTKRNDDKTRARTTGVGLMPSGIRPPAKAGYISIPPPQAPGGFKGGYNAFQNGVM